MLCFGQWLSRRTSRVGTFSVFFKHEKAYFLQKVSQYLRHSLSQMKPNCRLFQLCQIPGPISKGDVLSAHTKGHLILDPSSDHLEYKIIQFFFFFTTTPAAYGSSRLGVEWELQAYTTATAMADPSRTCHLHRSWRSLTPGARLGIEPASSQTLCQVRKPAEPHQEPCFVVF